ncbi:cyclic nucleotide-binding domain-containing protein [Cupriavidus necator]|uniref:cyclic nucleotide-binding domain-containing protein n=1 Tax=Cupriavidus necator TaxID=106590 RepID=UPI003ECDCB8B
MTQFDECHLPCDGMPCSAGCHLARFCLGGTRGLPGGAQGIQRTVRLRKGQCLYLLGDPVTSLYAIRVGTVKTHVTTEDGRTHVVGFHFPGDLVGLDSLAHPYYASYATALETPSCARSAWTRCAAPPPACRRLPTSCSSRSAGRRSARAHCRPCWR